MALQAFITDSSGTGVRAALGEIDHAFVAAGVNVVSTLNSTIVGAGAGHQVNVFGTTIGWYSAIVLGDDVATDPGQQVFIAETGSAGSYLGPAIYISGPGSTVDNQGYIWGREGISMQGDGSPGSRIFNSGKIDVQGLAISHAGTEAFVLENEGLIRSRNAFAFAGGEGNDSITNTGKIVGNVSLGSGDDVFDGSLGIYKGNVTGGEGNDRIICGAGNQTISGNAGMDVLTGGKGKDIFYFNTALAGDNVDAITDFNVRDDLLRLNDFNFDGLSIGALPKSAFAANRKGVATDASDRIIYETDTGKLFFDADGKGGAGGILFAEIDKGLKLTANDFEIY